jgi:hypothetical protein
MYTQKTWSYTHLQGDMLTIVEAMLWNSGKEGKENRMIVINIKILHICAGRGHNDMY